MLNSAQRLIPVLFFLASPTVVCAADNAADTEFFERHVRPILVQHCYECHSEKAQMREGGLLLDRSSGWLEGGDTGKAVVAGQPNASLLLKAVEYDDEDLQMPPDEKLPAKDIAVLKKWIRLGAPGAKVDPGTTEFSRLGDQDYLFEQAAQHWAFQPVRNVILPDVTDKAWNQHPVDRLVFDKLADRNLTPSHAVTDRILLRRLYYTLTGLPPSMAAVTDFEAAANENRPAAVEAVVDRLTNSTAYGEHVARLWLDVARYADTDSAYRPDTKTPHYFPFAFTYRDYVIDSFNRDTPFDQFVKEQLAADLLGFKPSERQTAALGFLAIGPHARSNNQEAIDDRIDVTTRGLLGMTASCARCHDHKFEPVPTADYYALHGVFASITRFNQLDEKRLPVLAHYKASGADVASYKKKRAAIDKKIKAAEGKKSRGNNRSVSQKIRETELAELLLFHPGAPAHTMVVADIKTPVDSFIAIRGDVRNRGRKVGRRFLTVLDTSQSAFPTDNSGRLALAEKIVSAENPLTARVYVNRIWGLVMGAHLVPTPSDFGLQGVPPQHPELLDWLAADFMRHGWSTKRLVKQLVLSRTFQQQSRHRDGAAAADPNNQFYWRANRRRLSIEEIRDTMLSVSAQLDRTVGGRAAELWGDIYLKRRAIYGYVNRFNLDPTLRAFDFPSRMQTRPRRNESIVAPQALFTMNSPFVIDQAVAVTKSDAFRTAKSDENRVQVTFNAILQRSPELAEVSRMVRFVEQQTRLFEKPRKGSTVTNPWPLVVQALLMSNEFQYVD